MAKPTVIEHPAVARRQREVSKAFSEAWGRHMRMMKQVDVVRDMAWTGMLAANFTRAEFESFSYLISPHELSLARKIWPDLNGTEPTGEESDRGE